MTAISSAALRRGHPAGRFVEQQQLGSAGQRDRGRRLPPLAV
jgi:hypothetical protein